LAKRTIVGKLVTIAGFFSPELNNYRDILIYLPPSYDNGGIERYPVVYMHDGQNLFDATTSYIGVEWRVDETMEVLAQQGIEAIVVGIPNNGERRSDEYSPFVDEASGGGGRGDAYVAFLANTLKPHIDRAFRTRPEAEATTIMGSSMGGLISLYALLQRPDTFGNAGLMSGAFWFGERAIFDYVRQYKGVPGRVYLDVGTAEETQLKQDVRKMGQMLMDKGYTFGRKLRYVEEQGGEHNEQAWGRRFGKAIRWLLRGK
ncbi:MAG: alpha/beta hydrolase, partial [Chloroflexia bacterium]|nr:alpha/beta hydrolase [Chloroflexia bacterium]